MKLKRIKYCLILMSALLVFACAQINPLTGGEKDTYAPRIDSSGTYPLSGQTNFKGDEIVIKFQEFVALNKPTDNIIITPQLKEKPDISVKNKKLTIHFNEVLEENTTYTINFNHAVTDITEKNDSIFQFVFSTGNFIDSLTVEGSISDAFTNQPAKGYLIGLYPASLNVNYDTLARTTKPTYITQTNESGNFKMNYLKNGDYFIFAINDKNRNLLLDNEEEFAFYPSENITINENVIGVDLVAFAESASELKLMESRFTYPGKVELILNDSADSIAFVGTLDLIKENTGALDSLVYWTAKNPVPKMQFYITLNNEQDTIKPLYKGSPTIKSPKKLTFTDNLIQGKLLPSTKFEITISEPITDVDESRIHFLTKDSVELDFTGFKIQNVRTIAIDSIPDAATFVKVDSGAINTIYSSSNKLDKWWSIEQLKPAYFGSLILNVDTVFAVPVIVELLNDKNEVVRVQPFEKRLEFIDLIPGKYQIRLIFDENNDGVWTTGALIERRMPERVLYNKELIGIKSRWEKEVDWIIGN